MTEGQQERLCDILHELSNVMTGVLMNGGLLRLSLRGGCHEHYAIDVCEAGERGAALVREARILVTPPEEMFRKIDEAGESSNPGVGYGESIPHTTEP